MYYYGNTNSPRDRLIENTSCWKETNLIQKSTSYDKVQRRQNRPGKKPLLPKNRGIADGRPSTARSVESKKRVQARRGSSTKSIPHACTTYYKYIQTTSIHYSKWTPGCGGALEEDVDQPVPERESPVERLPRDHEEAVHHKIRAEDAGRGHARL